MPLEEYEYLRDSCQVLVALTHIGSKYDRELADEASEYDLIIGGHSHERINEVEDGVLITQTGRNLNMVGVTEVRLRGKEILSLSFRLVPLTDYAPDPVYQEMVEAYRNNPVLKEKAGELTATADKVGVATSSSRRSNASRAATWLSTTTGGFAATAFRKAT